MRFAPGTSLDVVYVAGLGARPAAPMVTVARADGSEAPIAPGHSPGWLDNGTVVYCPPDDGRVIKADAESGTVFGVFVNLPAGNTLTAAAGKVAVHRTDPRRVLASWWPSALQGFTDPVLSADGAWLAMLWPDRPTPGQSALVLLSTTALLDPQIRYVGAPTRPRFSHDGASLCWEGGQGSIYGIADVANPASPVVRLSRPTDRLYAPVPCWVPQLGKLLVLYLQDRGDFGVQYVAEWGSCVAGAPMGLAVYQSTGSAYDHDIAPDGNILRVAFLTPDGSLGRGSLEFLPLPLPLPPAPEPPTPEPAPDWSFVPDGQLVTDAFRFMFGAHPPTSADGTRICLHKNVNEQEWREVNDRDAYHLFDRSRYPGDVGWYLVGNVGWSGGGPLWASNRFASGNSFGWDGEIVEMSNGRRNRWHHRNALYGLAAGGICVQFDPRFPGQDYGDQKCYERQFSRADGRIRWELWFSPEAARALPWGDRSLDVLKQAVEAQTDPNATPLPYLECPRLSVDDDPWKPEEPPMPDLKSREQFFAEFRALNAFYAAPEGLQRPGGMLFPVDAGNPVAHVDAEAMAAWGYDLMTGASVESCKARIRSSDEWKQKHAGDPVQPVTFSGPISVSGAGFVVPE